MEKQPLSVGIAAICEQGRYVVTACDEMISYGDLTSDAGAKKVLWHGPWFLMFAGNLSDTQLVIEEMRYVERVDKDALDRSKVLQTVRNAFLKRIGQWNEVRHLAPLGMTMEKFQREGAKQLGDRVAAQFATTMHDDYEANFGSQIMVVGWGLSERAALIYSIDRNGDGIHGDDGFYAIGSGAPAAISTLMLLGHHRDAHLEDAIYCVAAAKFSSEAHGIGKATTMWIGRKEKDKVDGTPGLVLQEPEIKKLRSIWERYGKPRIPEKAREFTRAFTEQKLNDQIIMQRREVRAFWDNLNRMNREAAQSKRKKSDQG